MAAYLQLVDMLADGALHDARDLLISRARAALAKLSGECDYAMRQTALAALVGRPVNFDILVHFAHASPTELAPLLQRAEMDDAEWTQLVPLLPPPARALLKERRDLPEAAQAALSAMGPAAILLDGPRQVATLFTPAPELAHAPSASVPDGPPMESGHPTVLAAANQLQDLLDRIRRYRSRLAAEASAEAEAEAEAGVPADTPAVRVADMGEAERRSPLVPIAGSAIGKRSDVAPARPAVAAGPDKAQDARLIDWGWETDAGGRLVAATDAARDVVGTHFGDIAGASASELDAMMVRHTAFRDRVLTFDGLAALRGVWKLSAVPLFDPADGRFSGYRGTARATEPRAVRVQPGHVGLFGTGASFEKLSSMAHEVRTPLNAILGFAQMIDGEVLGHAAPEYRDRARAIIANSQKLMSALDDLTDTARIAKGRFSVVYDEIDIADAVRSACVPYQQLAQKRGIILDMSLAPGLPHVWTDRSLVERTLARLLAGVVANGRAGEILWLSVRAESGDWLRIQLSRPEALADLSSDRLFDPHRMARDMTDSPILGLGFSLRFVRQLCGAMGAAFLIEPRQFVIRIPALVAATQAS